EHVFSSDKRIDFSFNCDDTYLASGGNDGTV
ncbi:hypothetical protein Pmar_PMAR008246, partial [Perkinsus marinus ATCC 50983]